MLVIYIKKNNNNKQKLLVGVLGNKTYVSELEVIYNSVCHPFSKCQEIKKYVTTIICVKCLWFHARVYNNIHCCLLKCCFKKKIIIYLLKYVKLNLNIRLVF